MSPTYTDILTAGEVVALTGKKYHAAQIKELNHMGLSYRTRATGSVFVVRADLPMDKPASEKTARFGINV